MPSTEVSLRQGRLRGVEGESVKGDRFVQFLGVPYAKPPLGDLRFKAPQPAEPWEGVRDASKEGNSAIARKLTGRTMVGSEDCLYLNVFTREIPRKNRKGFNLKPVMVWVHGGAFTMGFNTIAVLGPEVLMQKDIVLVIFNYRLGILGFLSLDDPTLEIPGNAGLKDQVMALKWVQENIESFGGDPKNVTIFGNSSGAVSVHLLFLSPTTKGLFHRAIAMSGSALIPWTWGCVSSREIAKVLGLKAQTEKELLEFLMTKTPREIFEIQIKFPDNFWDVSSVRPFCPIIEKPNPTAFLEKHPREIMASEEYNQVPFMIGFTSREGLILDVNPDVLPPVDDLPDYFVSREYGFHRDSEESKRISDKIREKYFGEEEGRYEAAADILFTNAMIETVERQVKNSKCPIYLYQISQETKLGLAKVMFKLANRKGVAHADDIGLLFYSSLYPRPCDEGSEEERARDRMVALVTNFARYGNPTPSVGEFGILWPPVGDPANLVYLDIGERLGLKVAPFAERVAFWKELRLGLKGKL